MSSFCNTSYVLSLNEPTRASFPALAWFSPCSMQAPHGVWDDGMNRAHRAACNAQVRLCSSLLCCNGICWGFFFFFFSVQAWTLLTGWGKAFFIFYCSAPTPTNSGPPTSKFGSLGMHCFVMIPLSTTPTSTKKDKIIQLRVMVRS